MASPAAQVAGGGGSQPEGAGMAAARYALPLHGLLRFARLWLPYRASPVFHIPLRRRHASAQGAVDDGCALHCCQEHWFLIHLVPYSTIHDSDIA